MAHVEDRRWATDRRTGERVRTDYNGPSPWRARYRTPDGQARAKGFSRKVDAERFLTSVEHDKITGAFVDPTRGRVTFGEVAEIWMGTVSHLKPKTLLGYRSRLSSALLPAFGNVPISAIDAATVKRFCSTLLTQRSYQTTKLTLNVLRAVLGTAVDSRLIAVNPAAGIKLDRGAARTARQRRQSTRVFLSSEQVAELVKALDGEFAILVRFAVATGMRAGEIEALQVDDLDLDARRITVRRTVGEVRAALVIGTPKNGLEREVTIPTSIRDQLEAHLRSTGRQGTELVFQSPHGGMIRHTNFYRRTFKPAAVRAGMPDALRFHDLRHTCASLLLAEGVSLLEVSRRLGHSSIAVTSDVYGHLSAEVEDRAADAMDRALGGVSRAAKRSASSSRPARSQRPVPPKPSGRK